MQCWNCGMETMWPSDELGKGWFQCSDCKATWVKPLVPGQATGMETVTHYDGSKGKHFKAKLVRKKAKK